jgi:uncharacterized membrane protein YjjP (DUF1212 family)
MPTACFFTLIVDGVAETSVVRISKRRVDLDKVNYINDISHRLASGSLTAKSALGQLDSLKNKPERKKILSIIGFALCAAGFCGAFGGGWLELIIAFCTGVIMQIISFAYNSFGLHSFFTSFTGGIIAAGVSLLTSLLIPELAASSIIIGVIMPLLPGVALTNCIRDIMNGDLVSGSARLMEALLTGVCIAVGAGIVMVIFTANGGVILQ